MAKKFEIIGLILIIILNCCQTTTITQQNEPFIGASSSILVNLLEISSNQKNLLNQTCSQHLNELLIGIKNRDQWAIKALDASARIQSEFLYGNNYWLGSPTECSSLNKPFHITLNNRFHRVMKSDLLNTTAPYDIGYRVIHARHNSPWQIEVELFITEKILLIGLCVPTDCTDNEIGVLTQLYIDTNLQTSLENRPIVEKVKDLNVKTNFAEKLSVKIFGSIIGFTFVMIGLAAIIDREPQNIIEKCIMCFSIRQNWKSFTIPHNNELVDKLYVINGLKGVGSIIVMVFHTAIFTQYLTDNPVVMFAKQESIELPFIMVTPYVVDLFFTISGFLLVYNFLLNPKKTQEIKENNRFQNIKLFGTFMLHRYIRFGIMYFVVMLFAEISSTYLLETTPFYYVDRYDVSCRNHWLRHLLFTQDFYGSKDLCGKWLYSVACDMQFFILTLAILFIYIKNQRLAKIMGAAIFFVTLFIVFGIGMHTEFTLSHDVVFDLGDELYLRPWARIFPYIIGGYFAWYFYERKSKLNFGKISSQILWILATVIMLGSHFGWAQRNISVFAATTALTIYKCLYSIAACWIIMATISDGYGSWLTRILNMSFLQQFKNICFVFFMINPLIIRVLVGFMDRQQHFNPILMSIMAVGLTVITYWISFPVSLLFEIPYNKFVLTVLNGRKQKFD